MESYDLIIIGGGWAGIMHAKTYHTLHPESRMLILDKNATLGGTWSKRRLLPGLKTNNMVGTFEFSDLPINKENGFDIEPGHHVPGSMIHQYLYDYCTKHGLHRYFRFEQDVREVMQLDNARGWVITIAGPPAEEPITQVTTRKLVVATGLTSEPFLPEFKGESELGVPIVHCGQLLDYSEKLAEARNVVVLGGTKSAWDAAYEYATRDIHVDMVIRESGHGPCWMAPSFVTPLKKLIEKLVTTRALSFFSPCMWGHADGFTVWRNFLHQTSLGRALVRGFWAAMGSDVLSANNYGAHPETQKLKPWVDVFWVAGGLSILNYDTDFFQLVRDGKISVHIADITHLSPGTVHLPESSIATDALICATGWKFHPPLTFVNSHGECIDKELGLPHRSSIPESDDPRIQTADRKIFETFPALKAQPTINPRLKPESYNRGFQLFRFIAPPSLDRTIVFAGALQTIGTAMVYEAQALWSAAYLDEKILGDESGAEEEAVMYARFAKWRTPGGYGSRYPDMAFESIPYIDWLLKDLGLKSRRKKSFFRELWEPYVAGDYRGLMEEYKAKYGAE